MDGAQPVKNNSSRGISSNASNYNISKRQGNVNSIQKEAISQGGVASFVEDYSGKSSSNINPDEVISGMWEGASNVVTRVSDVFNK